MSHALCQALLLLLFLGLCREGAEGHSVDVLREKKTAGSDHAAAPLSESAPRLLAQGRARRWSAGNENELTDARHTLEDIAKSAREDAEAVERQTATFQEYCERRILTVAQIAGRRAAYTDAAMEGKEAAAEAAKLGAQADGLSKEAEDAWSSWRDAVAARANTHLSYIEESRKADMTLDIYDSVMVRLAQGDTQQADADAAPPRNLDNLNIKPLLAQLRAIGRGSGSGFHVVIGGLKSMTDAERKEQKERERGEQKQVADFEKIMATLQKEIEDLMDETEVRQARRREISTMRKVQASTRSAGFQLLQQAMKASDQLHDVCLAAAGAGRARVADLEVLRASATKAATFVSECIAGLGQGTPESFLSLSEVKHPELPTGLIVHGKPPWETKPASPAAVDPVTARMLRMMDGADQIAEEPRHSERKSPKQEKQVTNSGEIRAARWMLLAAAQRTGKVALRLESEALQGRTEAEDEQALVVLKSTLVAEGREDAATAAASEAVGDVTQCGGAQLNASTSFREASAIVTKLRDLLASANASALASSVQVELMEHDLEEFKETLSENRAKLSALDDSYAASAQLASDASERTKSKFRAAIDFVRDLNETNARFVVHTDDSSKQTSTRAGDDSVDARNLETYIDSVERSLQWLSAKSPQEQHVVGLSQNVVFGGTGAITEKSAAISSVQDARGTFEGWQGGNATQLNDAESFIVDDHALWLSEMNRCQKLMEQTLVPTAGDGTAESATAEAAIDGALSLLRHGSLSS